MFKNKTLNEIGERFFCERREFKTKEKITFLERLSMCFPGLSLISLFNIRRKIKKEIKRAEKESNKNIKFNVDFNVATMDYLNIYWPILINIFYLLSLFAAMSGLLPIFINMLSCALFIFTGICGWKMPEITCLESFINQRNYKKDESLSEQDMILLAENIPNDLFQNFLIKKDFNITYYSLWDLQKELNNYENKIIESQKAKDIIITLSEKIKEKEVINV